MTRRTWGVTVLLVVALLLGGLASAGAAAGGPPVNQSPPTISGTLRVGELLTASPGEWTPQPASYGYSWFRDDVAVKTGAHAATYRLTGADMGRKIAVEVTGIGADLATRDPGPIDRHCPRRLGRFRLAGASRIVGPRRWGHELTVANGTLSPKPTTIRYQWLADGRRRPPDAGDVLRGPPPDHFPLSFYRWPTAPDLLLTPDDLPLEAVAGRGVLGHRHRAVPGAAPGHPPRRLGGARAGPGTPCSTSTGARCSGPTPPRRRAEVGRALEHVTVAVGNREECEVAVGESDPHRAADALLERGRRAGRRQAGPARRARSHGRGAGRGRAVPRRGRQRARAPATRSAARSCTACSRAGTSSAIVRFANVAGRDRRRPPRVLHRDADDRRGRGRPRRGRAVSTVGTAASGRRHRAAHRGAGPRAAAGRAGLGRAPAAARCCPRTAGCSSSPPTTRPAAPSASGATRWRWPAARTCSTGSSPPSSGPGSTASSAPRTSSRTFCSSARSRTRWSSGR